MPAQKGVGAFLVGRTFLGPLFRILAGLFAVCAILFIFLQPLFAFAAVVPDPTGRGWTCEGNQETVDTWGTPVRVGTVTCRAPGNSENTWQEDCPDSGAFVREVAIGADVMDCRITITQDGASQTYQGDRVRHTTFGYQPFRVILDPDTGAPTGEVEEGEATNLLSFGADQVGNVTLEFVGWIVWFITEILVWIADFILATSGAFFDFITSEFVIQMAKYITAPEATAVRTAWTLIRDLANIGIIGGLVATAIGTIIGSSKINIQGTLARLILAALLVNFSYFFAGAIIDFSNFTAKAAYDSVIRTPGCENDCGIAARVARVSHIDTDLDTLLERSAGQEVRSANRDFVESASIGERQRELRASIEPSAKATINVMYLVFVSITTFVFLSAIALLVGRFVVLIFLLVTSPIGIAGGAVPLLSKYSKEWWDALWNQALFAPVYFVLAGIALNILDQFSNTLLGAGYDETARSIADNGGATVNALQQMVGIVAMFTVAIGFMWAALAIAKSMSEKGSQYFKPIYGAAQKAFGWLPGGYQSILKGGAYVAGIGLRDTIGKGAHEAGIAYRKWAEKNRPDERKGLLGGIARAGDRALKAQLDKVQSQKFFGAKGYHDLHEERKARRSELSRGELTEELRGMAEGKLTPKLKDELDNLEAQKASGITKEEAAQLKELEDKEKRGEKLTAEEQAQLAALRERRANAGLTNSEKAKLPDIEKKLKDGVALTSEEQNIHDRQKYGGLTEAQKLRYDELHYANTPGGILGRFADAEKKATGLRKQAEHQNINEVAREQALRAEKSTLEAIPEKERTESQKAKLRELAFYEQKAADKKRFAVLEQEKASGAWDKLSEAEREKKIAEHGELEARSRAGDLDLKTKARETDQHAAYWTRQAELGKDGRKSDESLVGYYERVEKKGANEGGSGLREALGKLQALDAQMPPGFIDRLYDEYEHNPKELVKWAPMLRPEDYEKLMKDDKFPRDIKDEMRVARHGEWMDMIDSLDKKVKNGEILEGSPEYKELQGIAYRYAMKRFKDKREFNDLMTSRVGARFRKMRTMWNGGSLTSMWQGSRELFGQYEGRDIAALKRQTYYGPQRMHTAAQALTGLEPVWEKDSNGNFALRDGYRTPNKTDSDNFVAIKESWSEAQAEIDAAQQILDSADASAQAKIEADDRKRFWTEALKTRDPERKPENQSAFERDYPAGPDGNINDRIRAVYEYNEKAKALLQRVDRGDITKAQADAIARADDKLFITYHQQKAERGMAGFAQGKSASEMHDMVSPERTYANATVIGKTADTLAQMMSDYDLRWRDAIRVSFLIEKGMSEIQDLTLNEANMKAFGGWPVGDELEFINRQRRIKYGLPPDQESSVDLPETAQEFAGLSPQRQMKMGSRNAGSQESEDEEEI